MASKFRFSMGRDRAARCRPDRLCHAQRRLRESCPNRGVVAGLTAVVVLVVAGCGGDAVELPRAAVHGTVTLDGQPLQDAVIRFIPTGETKGPATSVSIVDGQFEANEQVGPIVGQHRIEIQSNDDGGFAFDDEQALEKLNRNPQRIQVQAIPGSYNINSVLEETVEAGEENGYKFELRSPKKTSRRS